MTVGINKRLAQIVRKHSNTFLADVDAIGSALGKSRFLDDTIFFNSHGAVLFPDWSGHENAPFWTTPEPGRIDPVPDMGTLFDIRTDEFFEAAYLQIEHNFRVSRQVDQVKLVVFDLDNTLWRGQIGDHYVPGQQWPYADGWPMGVWETIQHLRARGILVSLASKNDAAIVQERWANAVTPPFVSLQDFVVPQISWGAKSDGMSNILKLLNLTAKSTVFVDDNPVEREAMKMAFPDIRVMGSNPFNIKRTLLWASETQVVRVSDESSRRDEMIRAQVEREAVRDVMNREDFLRLLRTEITVDAVKSFDQREYNRALELINKTNQFNTTGERWVDSDLRAFFLDGGEIFTFSVKDKFADYGIVGVVLLRFANVEQFVMSCRVFGMDIENQVLRYLSRVRSTPMMKLRFAQTRSNGPVLDFLASQCEKLDDEPEIYAWPKSKDGSGNAVSIRPGPRDL